MQFYVLVWQITRKQNFIEIKRQQNYVGQDSM